MNITGFFSAVLPFILVTAFSQTSVKSCRKGSACATAPENLIAYYNFNGGNLNDSSGHNNHIKFNNATPAADRFGRLNNAYFFDGKSHMTVPNSSSLNPDQEISMMAVIKIKDFNREQCGGNNIFGKGFNDFADGFYVLRIAPTSGCSTEVVDVNREYISAGFGDFDGRAGAYDYDQFLKPEKWYNIIYTHGKGVSKLYVNGILVKQHRAKPTISLNTQDLFIGRNGDSSMPYSFNGTIDEVRIYRKALCLDEVKLLNMSD